MSHGPGWNFGSVVVCGCRPGWCIFPGVHGCGVGWWEVGEGASDTFSSSFCSVGSVNEGQDRASAAKLSVPLTYFKVIPYSSKVIRCRRTRSDDNFFDGWIRFLWSVWTLMR